MATSSSVRREFESVDWLEPFDLEAALAVIPEDATVRGMFFQFLEGHLLRVNGKPLGEFEHGAFQPYPARDYVRMIHATALALYPDAPVREALRRVGHFLYDDFQRTMVGRAIFAVAGRDFARLCSLAHKAYGVSYAPCELRAAVVSPGRATVVMAPVHILPDTFQVGAWEGAARFCGLSPTIRIHRVRPGFVEFDVRYGSRGQAPTAAQRRSISFAIA